jgi:hypothetical protein
VGKRFWRAETGFFLGIWLFFMLAGRSRLFRDPGTFWHTVVGRLILGSRGFFDTDSFSFTRAGERWIPHQWLGECLMAILDWSGGLDTLLLATATVLAAFYCWIAHRLLKNGLHWLPTVFFTMLSIAASANHLHARPHISTIIFLGLTFGWLCDFEAGRIGLGRLGWLVPVFWAWSSTHGGVLGGLATLGLALCGWCFFRLAGLDSPIAHFRQAVLLFSLIVACAATALVNPYGLALPRAWLEIVGSPVVSRLIEEHAPLDPRGPAAWLILLLGLVYTATVAGIRPWRPRFVWLIPFFWLGQTLLRVRHSPLFAITASLALADMLPHTRLAKWLARPGRDLFQFRTAEPTQRRGRDWRPAFLPLLVVVLALSLQASGSRAPFLGPGVGPPRSGALARGASTRAEASGARPSRGRSSFQRVPLRWFPDLLFSRPESVHRRPLRALWRRSAARVFRGVHSITGSNRRVGARVRDSVRPGCNRLCL